VDFFPLMVRPMCVDVQFFPTDSLRQAAEILWLTVALLAILCRRILRVAPHRQQSLLVFDPSHELLALLDRSCTYVPVSGAVDAQFALADGAWDHESPRKSCVIRVPWMLTMR
jgi:hypothetical protein